MSYGLLNRRRGWDTLRRHHFKADPQHFIMDILNQPLVLVLNKSWQPINTRTVSEAILQMAADAATGLDIDGSSMSPVKWSDWINLPIREHDDVIHTPNRSIRVPKVIVLCNFAKVPKKRPRFSSKAIFERDKGVCQYTGKKLSRADANIDHVIPVSRGGETNWQNCVLADKSVNFKKADRTPNEAGLKLIKKPEEPPMLPVSVMIKNDLQIPEWRFFLTS